MGWWHRLFGGRMAGAAPEPAAAQAGDADARAERFWRRWEQLAPEVCAALGDGQPRRFENALCEAVAALHPDLQFSVETGRRATYALVITGQEDPALRPYTDAWAAAAPQQNDLWEYHDHIPPVPDPDAITVNVAEYRIALADVRLAAQVDGEAGLVDVAVYHPLLGELSESSRATMTFLPLEATLGERLAARRLRRVETAATEPQDAVDLGELRELVCALDERHGGPGSP